MESFGVIDPALLEKIDLLFEYNIGELISLPQIVVVGDQSCGKSSVLEGLTGLPFPRSSGLCTRFPTQIIFRRAIVPLISASIVPGKNATKERRAELKNWKKSDLDSLDHASFANIMVEAAQVMGIQSPEERASKTFSNDILRLEIAGPDKEHFSVIDVPGIFRRTTEGLTTKEDMAMVESIVHEYMSNPRSIMLPVVPCNVDIATQDILQKAVDLDLDGSRTFGILTKPDLMDRGSENSIISLIEGKTQNLRLGWHLLRNPGQADLTCSLQERCDVEKNFFRDVHPWNTLDERNLGIESLRSRLQGILGDHIRREFPKVKAEISRMLAQSEKDLKALGQKRQTPTEQCQYLTDLAFEFQKITGYAIQSNYNRSEILNKNKKLRIATEVINRGQKFANAMKSYGHQYEFAQQRELSRGIEDDEETYPTSGIAELPTPKREIEDDEGSSSDRDNESFTDLGDIGDQEQVRLEDDHIDIQDVVYARVKVPKETKKDILPWLKKEYRESRGFELGTFDAHLLSYTMQKQAAKWRDLALGYISDIISLVHSFILRVIDHITPNVRVRDGIKAHLLEDMTKMYEDAIAKTEFLISVELDGTPATYSPYFNKKIEKACQQHRQKCSITAPQYSNVDHLCDIDRENASNNDKDVVVKVHHILHSYYKVARQRFVDCVRMQVADTLLVTGLKTPLTLFSAKFVTNMEPKALEEVAGEDVAMKRRREDLERRTNQLREGKRIIG